MASLSGKGGSISGVNNADCTNWAINLTVDLVDVTNTESSGWKSFVEGLYGATGSFTAVGSTLPTRGAATGTFITDSGASVTISGSIIVESVTITSDVAGRVEFSGSFTFNGQPTVS